MNELYDRFAHWAALDPERICIVEPETGRRISYGRLFAAVQAMRRLIGAPPRNIIATLPGGIQDAVLWLTALTGGYLLFPLAPDAAVTERVRALSMFRPDVLLVGQKQDVAKFGPVLTDQVITNAECDSLIEQAGQAAIEPREPQLGSVCIMTSGTTGTPKGVVLNAQQVAWTADHVRTSHGLTSRDIGLTPLPLFHINGAVVGCAATVMAGATVVIARKFSRRRFWSWVQDYSVTWISIVPTIVAMLLNDDKPAFLPGAVRFARTGASALPATDLHAFETKFGIPVIETYGLSEAASQVTANPLPPGRRKPGSAGLPVGISLRICRPHVDGDDELHDVPRGDTGEICVRGPSVITAYYGNAGREAFQAGWFRTGDLGHQDEDGYVFVHARLRDIIVRGGENIAPREVEEVLEMHPAVREAAVVGRPDRILGETVVAYVVPAEPWSPELERSVRRHAARRLSPHKVPVDYHAVDSLPRNEMGKLQHHVLARAAAGRQQRALGEARR